MPSPGPNLDKGSESGAERLSAPLGSSDERVLLDQMQPVAPIGSILNTARMGPFSV